MDDLVSTSAPHASIAQPPATGPDDALSDALQESPSDRARVFTAARAATGLSQDELAIRAGVARSVVQRLENPSHAKLSKTRTITDLLAALRQEGVTVAVVDGAYVLAYRPTNRTTE